MEESNKMLFLKKYDRKIYSDLEFRKIVERYKFFEKKFSNNKRIITPKIKKVDFENKKIYFEKIKDFIIFDTLLKENRSKEKHFKLLVKALFKFYNYSNKDFSFRKLINPYFDLTTLNIGFKENSVILFDFEQPNIIKRRKCQNEKTYIYSDLSLLIFYLNNSLNVNLKTFFINKNKEINLFLYLFEKSFEEEIDRKKLKKYIFFEYSRRLTWKRENIIKHIKYFLLTFRFFLIKIKNRQKYL